MRSRPLPPLTSTSRAGLLLFLLLAACRAELLPAGAGGDDALGAGDADVGAADGDTSEGGDSGSPGSDGDGEGDGGSDATVEADASDAVDGDASDDAVAPVDSEADGGSLDGSDVAADAEDAGTDAGDTAEDDGDTAPDASDTADASDAEDAATDTADTATDAEDAATDTEDAEADAEDAATDAEDAEADAEDAATDAEDAAADAGDAVDSGAADSDAADSDADAADTADAAADSAASDAADADADVAPPCGGSDCDDKNPCTADACVANACKNVVKSFGACDDGDGCTVDDACSDGVCVGGAPKPCDDGNACTKDGCADDTCNHFGKPGQACDDGDACTPGDTCNGGTCVAGKPMVCTDSNPCTDDACVKGACVATANTAPCDDGQLCTLADVCQAKACKGAPATTATHVAVRACGSLLAPSYPRQAAARHSSGVVALVGSASCNPAIGNKGLGSALVRVQPTGAAADAPVALWSTTSNGAPRVAATMEGWTVVTRVGEDAEAKIMATFVLANGEVATAIELPFATPAGAEVVGIAATPEGATLVHVRGKPAAGDFVSDGAVVLRLADHKIAATQQSTATLAAEAIGLLPVPDGFLYVRTGTFAGKSTLHRETWGQAPSPKSTVVSAPGLGYATVLGPTGNASIVAVAGFLAPGGPSAGKSFLALANIDGTALSVAAMIAGASEPVILIPYDIVAVPDGLLVAGIGGSGPTVLRYNTSGQLVNTWKIDGISLTGLVPVPGSALVMLSGFDGAAAHKVGFLGLAPAVPCP